MKNKKLETALEEIQEKIEKQPEIIQARENYENVQRVQRTKPIYRMPETKYTPLL